MSKPPWIFQYSALTDHCFRLFCSNISYIHHFAATAPLLCIKCYKLCVVTITCRDKNSICPAYFISRSYLEGKIGHPLINRDKYKRR